MKKFLDYFILTFGMLMIGNYISWNHAIVCCLCMIFYQLIEIVNYLCAKDMFYKYLNK